MKEIIIALLGGGAFVQLCHMLGTLTPERRRTNAEALGTEVAALERTINVIYKQFEESVQRHAGEVASLREEIKRLQDEVARLEQQVREGGGK